MGSPISIVDRNSCCLCGKEFSLYDQVAKLGESGYEKMKRHYGDLTFTALHAVCADCLKDKPKIEKTSEDKAIIIPRDLTKGLFYLFKILVFISSLALLYSLTKKLFNLPNFPFNLYIGIHMVVALFSLNFKHIRLYFEGTLKQPSDSVFPITIVLLISFLVPSFRHIFYSYLPSMIWKVGLTIIFTIALYLEIQLIRISLLRIFSKYRSFLLNLLTYFIPVIILISFISPFYFGCIEMNPAGSTDVIKAETVDKIYEKELSAETADEEIARRYFLDGKESASKGTETGFIKSIQFYKLALELKPNKFSTACAEMAYSYCSIAEILRRTGVDKRKIEENYEKAEKAIEKAKKISEENPTTIAVELLVQYRIANFYLSDKGKLTNDEIHRMESKIEWVSAEGLKKLRELVKRVGSTDKVFLAQAMLTEDRLRRGSLLLTVIEKIDADNAVVHNLLGLVYYLVNDKDSAKKMFERAKRLSPDFGRPYLNLALVYPKKEIWSLYKEAGTKEDSRELAGYYSDLHGIMRFLRWFYICLVIISYIGGVIMILKYTGGIDWETYEKNFIEIQGKFQEKAGRIPRLTFLILILTYGAFEIYIHFIKPVNGIDHMFPVKYPFF